MITVVVTLVIFLVMITLHEFGHFIMAKSVGVKVLEFAIGMGPAIFKKQGEETLYSIRVFPIGGYCKLEGEDGDSDDPRAFSNQKLWKRFLVVSAGAILNLLLGFVIFGIVVAISGPFKSNTIKVVDDRSYLAQSGIVAGDKIVSINGHRVNFYDDISLCTDEFEANKEFNITIVRDGEKHKYTLLPSYDETTVEYQEKSIKMTDTINGISEESVIEYDKDNIPYDNIGKSFTSRRYIIGFEPESESVTAFNIIPQAWYYTVYIVKSIYAALWDVISGDAGLNSFSGPVGVAGVVNQAVNSGKDSLINVLFIIAMLTVNLGIFNLLPLPALDGGRLFFMIVELIRRKPVPPEKEGMVHAIGLLLLLALAVVICFNDIMKLV